MVADLYPAASYEPVDYAGAAGPMQQTVLGWVEHVVVGNGDPWSTFEYAPTGNRRFSDLWFAKDGRVKQYQLLSRGSWAQVAGNATYWSCETEGDPSEPLTPQQIESLAQWHVWCGAADALAETPGDRGIGWNGMGGAAWGGHYGCPGDIRKAQRAAIIARAQQIRGGDMPLTPQDLANIADAVETRYQVHVGKALETRDQALGDVLVRLDAQAAAIAAIAAKLGVATP